MFRILKKTIAGLGLFFILFIFVVPAYGAELPEGFPITLNDIKLWTEDIVTSLIYIAGIAMVGFVVWSGIYWMYAGARGDEGKVQKAKDMLKAAIIGAAIVLGVGVILNTISNIFGGDTTGGTPQTQGGGGNGAPLPTTVGTKSWGQGCSRTTECKSPMMCDGGICQGTGNVGEVCDFRTDCQYPLNCGAGDKCYNPLVN